MRITHVILSFAFVLAASVASNAQNYKKAVEISDSVFQHFKALNDSETRLLEFKDSDEMLKAKLVQVVQINRSRKRYKAQPVQLDIHASRVANKICKEAAEKEYVGHWNIAGMTPYHRYAFDGGVDHVTENAYGQWGSVVPENTVEKHAELMLKGHREFMKERKPNDGHKQTCIDRDHNYVGLGSYLVGSHYRYYEEFVDRYIEFLEVPKTATRGQKVTVKVRTPEDQYLYFVKASYDKPLKPYSPRKINSKNSYNDYGREVKNMEFWGWELPGERNGQEYSIDFTFTKPGLYYIQMYIHDRDYDKIPKGGASTKGKIGVSGVVIEVK